MKTAIKRCSIALIVALGITLSPGTLRTSPEAQQKTASWEDCRASPYYCPAGVLTVGIGSTGNVQNRPYSNDEIARRWVNDMQRAENCVNGNFNGAAMPQSAFEAMTDTAFNLGCSGLMWFTNRQGSKQRTTIWKHAQAQEWPAMCERLTDFVNSGGQRSAGLVNRRNDFKAWCLRDLAGVP
ncbi:lysozyme [Dickeya zeae]|uniref:Lysozyme n=1 Tax=Dickeya zeae TaxID=204042 RepID=A0ABX8VTU0_9GAMM|nr:lysozyme [Dickeya zeae]QYM91237.1 lysozyme [Dickeya zeae]